MSVATQIAKPLDMFGLPPKKPLSAQDLDQWLAEVEKGEVTVKRYNAGKLEFSKRLKLGQMSMRVAVEEAAFTAHTARLDKLGVK